MLELVLHGAVLGNKIMIYVMMGLIVLMTSYLCVAITKLFAELGGLTRTVGANHAEVMSSREIKPFVSKEIPLISEGFIGNVDKVAIYKDGNLWHKATRGSKDHLEAINDPRLTVENL
jgi:hypothetical protein